MLRGLKRTAARLSPRRMSGRYPPPVNGALREDLGMPFIGVVRTSRHGLRWRRSWSLREQKVGWNHVRSCAVAPERRLEVPRHTHRLVLKHDEGQLEVIVRGPRGPGSCWPAWQDRCCGTAEDRMNRDYLKAGGRSRSKRSGHLSDIPPDHRSHRHRSGTAVRTPHNPSFANRDRSTSERHDLCGCAAISTFRLTYYKPAFRSFGRY